MVVCAVDPAEPRRIPLLDGRLQIRNCDDVHWISVMVTDCRDDREVPQGIIHDLGCVDHYLDIIFGCQGLNIVGDGVAAPEDEVGLVYIPNLLEQINKRTRWNITIKITPFSRLFFKRRWGSAVRPAACRLPTIVVHALHVVEIGVEVGDQRYLDQF